MNLFSVEGVTLKDPRGMMFYAVGLLPLNPKLKEGSIFVIELKKNQILNNEASWKQNWYADDSGCASDLKSVLAWLKLLMEEGPKFSYFPEPDKSYLVVHPNQVDEAKLLFAEFKVNVVTGNCFLGGFIGSTADTEVWVHEKVKVWVKSIKSLTKAAEIQPH